MSNVNPMQMIINRIQKTSGNNPMMANLIRMAQNNDVNGLEQFARNLGKEKGVNVDEYFNNAMQMFGMTK